MMASNSPDEAYGIHVQYLPEPKIIHARCVGMLDQPVLAKFIRATLRAGKLFNCYLFLVDLREADIDLAFIDLYVLPEVINAHIQAGGGKVYLSHKAIIISNEQEEDWKFFETLQQNENYQMSVFRDEESALAWLKEER